MYIIKNLKYMCKKKVINNKLKLNYISKLFILLFSIESKKTIKIILP